MAEPYYEILLSGPAGREQTIRAALVNAGVSRDAFVPAHHGWDHIPEEAAQSWIAYRADDLEAAEIAVAKAKGWRLRLYRHAIGLAIPSQAPPPPSPLEARIAMLEAALESLTGNRVPPPIAGGALESPPWVISADQHSADLFRQMPQSLLSGTGVINSGDLAVTPGGSQPPIAVQVAAGQVWMPGTSSGAASLFGTNSNAQSTIGNTNGGTTVSTGYPTTLTKQGSYYAINDATVSFTLSSADPTNPRIDLVCASVQDAEWSGSANQSVLQVVVGSAGASPAPTAPPASSVVLSSVWVPAGASSITTGDINDLRPFASSGLVTPGRTKATITYNPGSSGATYTNSTTTPAIVDGTNLVASVVAPASGRLRLSFEALQAASSTGALIMTVWNATASAEYSAALRVNMIQQAAAMRLRYDALITGLTPGATYSLGPGFCTSSATNVVSIYAGSTTAEAGPAWLEIASA